MGLAIDWYNSIIQVTSPDTEVDAQTLHDFIEDAMASPEGLLYADILQPEGKIENPASPGVYSQIILILNSPWQIQFWGGSGYTRIYGGKIVGGLADEPIKATGTAGDITVLESPVDGATIGGWSEPIDNGLTGAQLLQLMASVLFGKTSITDLGGGLATVKFRDLEDSKDRVTADMDGSERTDVTLNP